MNYSYQPTPEPTGFDISELNLPPKHRFNAGVGYNGPRILGNFGVSYASDAFWQDVLDSRYPRPDRRLHAGQRHHRLQVARRPPRHVAQDHQPRQRGSPPAHLRRPHPPPGRRRAPGSVLATRLPSPQPSPRKRGEGENEDRWEIPLPACGERVRERGFCAPCASALLPLCAIPPISVIATSASLRFLKRIPFLLTADASRR